MLQKEKKRNSRRVFFFRFIFFSIGGFVFFENWIFWYGASLRCDDGRRSLLFFFWVFYFLNSCINCFFTSMFFSRRLRWKRTPDHNNNNNNINNNNNNNNNNNKPGVELGRLKKNWYNQIIMQQKQRRDQVVRSNCDQRNRLSPTTRILGNILG